MGLISRVSSRTYRCYPKMYRYVARTTLKQALAKNQNHIIFAQNSLATRYFSTSQTQNIGFFEQLKEKANKKIDQQEQVKKDELQKAEERIITEKIEEKVIAENIVEETKIEKPELEKSRVSNWRLEKLEALEEEENSQ